MKKILQNRKIDNERINKRVKESRKIADVAVKLLEKSLKNHREKILRGKIFEQFKQDYLTARKNRKKSQCSDKSVPEQ